MLENRRSVRVYKEGDVDISNILKVALLSPSSKNRQPWELIVVDDKELLNKLSYCRGTYSPIIDKCNKAVIIVGDCSKHPDNVWIEDCSVVATTIHYQSHFEGYGSCWIQVRNRLHSDNKTASEYVKEMFDLESKFEVHSIITIGIANQEIEGRIGDKTKIHFNKFK